MLLLLSNAARSAVKGGALILLPEWTRRDTAALTLVLHLVPLIFGAALIHANRTADARTGAYAEAAIGAEAALTREAARFEGPLSTRTSYFLPAAVLATTGRPVTPAEPGSALTAPADRIEGTLRITALMTAICVLSLVYVTAWAATGRRWAAMIAAAIALLAASFEGLYVLNLLRHSGQPLSVLLDPAVNFTGRWVSGLSIDRLPRAMLWTQQYVAAGGLGLIAILAASRPMFVRRAGLFLIGMALSFSILFSPALGGAFLLVYLCCVVWDAVSGRVSVAALAPFAYAVVPPALALVWALNARDAGSPVLIAYVVSPYGAPAKALWLALGGVLIPAAIGLLPSRQVPFRPALPAAIALAIGLAGVLFSVDSSPGPVGRAGNLMLMTVAMLIARGLVVTYQRSGSLLAVTFASIVFLAGLPTTIIAWYTGQRLP
jgi:hypothetical protein